MLKALKLAELGNHKDYGDKSCHGVGSRECCPHAIQPEVRRQDEQHGDDENHLAREAHKD